LELGGGVCVIDVNSRWSLLDLGLTRSDALHEIRKPFWRA
jgi:hypothetical protein